MWSYFKFIIVLLYAKATFVVGCKVSGAQKYYEEDQEKTDEVKKALFLKVKCIFLSWGSEAHNKKFLKNP